MFKKGDTDRVQVILVFKHEQPADKLPVELTACRFHVVLFFQHLELHMQAQWVHNISTKDEGKEERKNLGVNQIERKETEKLTVVCCLSACRESGVHSLKQAANNKRHKMSHAVPRAAFSFFSPARTALPLDANCSTLPLLI